MHSIFISKGELAYEHKKQRYRKRRKNKKDKAITGAPTTSFTLSNFTTVKAYGAMCDHTGTSHYQEMLKIWR